MSTTWNDRTAFGPMGPGPRRRGGGPHHHPGMGPDTYEAQDWGAGGGPGSRGYGRRGGPGMGMGPAGRGRGRGRGRARRGAIRLLILAALTDHPMHGYEVIHVLGELSGGRWRPSAGSVYPTLQSLEDEGMVTSVEVDGKRIYSLTEPGREEASSQPMPEPWFDEEDNLRQSAQGLMAAIRQVDHIGSEQTRAEAYDLVDATRRQLYRLLAEDEPTSSAPVDSTPEEPAAEQ